MTNEKALDELLTKIDNMTCFGLQFNYKKFNNTSDTLTKECVSGRIDAYYHFAYEVVDGACIQDSIELLEDDIDAYQSKVHSYPYFRGYVSEAKKILHMVKSFVTAYYASVNCDFPLAKPFTMMDVNNFNVM